MKPEQIEWQNSEAQRYLDEQEGSKSGAHNFLFDNHPDLRQHLPTDTHYIAPGEGPEPAIAKMDLSKTKIVRGCHRLDVTGMVDVIPTRVCGGTEGVRMAIEQVLQGARSKDVRDFVEYESGIPFDGNVGILVQDFNRGESGSVIEHPHKKGAYRITVNKLPGANEDGYIRMSEKMYDSDGRTLHQYKRYENKCGAMPSGLDDLGELPPPEDLDRGALSSEDAKKVIELYRRIYETGLMPASHSYQMEFGMRQNQILFYQSRIFRPFEPAGEFSIEEIEKESGFGGLKSDTLIYNSFGITPAEGWELPLGELNTEFIERYAGENRMAYGYNNFCNRQCAPLNVQPRNLAVYMPYQHANVFEHGHFRWMQKAPVSLIGVRTSLREQKLGFTDMTERQSIDEKIRVRVYSNGMQGFAVVVK